MREKIKLMDNTRNVVIKMAEGNPGALRVLVELVQKPAGLIILLGLDDMNIRGWQIWVGYKDYSQSDLDAFMSNVKNRNPMMIDAINNEAVRMGSPLMAVTGGASFSR